MTFLVPLGSSSSPLQTPPFLKESPSPDVHIAQVVKAIMKAKRIVVICGAGISVDAGIPDFRSSEDLFRSIKHDNSREVVHTIWERPI
ncbi:hypothetical protein AX17_006586 [Amanita inopinata Kibby_2008]|nr:hypothetical protein AX17_006586 [Amanita inopinata Kibby_2008]